MAHLDRSGVGQIDRTKKIHLADIDAVVAEDGVGHRDVEKGVGDRHLQQVVLAADDFAGRPGEFDLAPAVPSLAGFRTPALGACGVAGEGPASENLHTSRTSRQLCTRFQRECSRAAVRSTNTRNSSSSGTLNGPQLREADSPMRLFGWGTV